MSELERLRDRVTELEEILGLNLCLPDALDLSKRETQIVGLLVKRPIVSRDAIFSAVYGSLPWRSQPDIKTIEVHICNIRRKLAKHGLEMKNRYGVGYYFENEAKVKLREFMEFKSVFVRPVQDVHA